VAEILWKRRVKLDAIQPSDENPRRITHARMDALRAAIKASPEMLELRPIIVNEESRIVAGEMRWRAAGLEGLTDVPASGVRFESQAEEREWRLRDNNPYGEWVEQELAQMLYELEQQGRDLEQTGFSREESTKLLDLVAGSDRKHRWPDDPAPSPPANPKSKAGQIYKLGPHRLMCGSAIDGRHVAKLLAGATPELLVTDPPYGVELELLERAGEKTRKRAGAAHKTTKLKGDTRVDWSEAFELVPSIRTAYVWHAGVFGDEVAAGLRRIGLEIAQQIIWDKTAFALSRAHYHWQHETAFYAAKLEPGVEIPWYGPIHEEGWYARRPGSGLPWLGSRDQHTIWQAPSPKMNRKGSEEAFDHPTQKPVLLWQRPIQNHLLRGEALYEPFAGSGTAFIAAEVTGRICYGMEIDPAFCDVIRGRYKAFTEGTE
jgi:DNA modification methylase